MSGARPIDRERPNLDDKEREHVDLDDVEQLKALEMVECQVELEDVELRPYGIHMATAIAVRHGKVELSRTLLDALYVVLHLDTAMAIA